jgi:IclR family acetate operon transcriptional repressor
VQALNRALALLRELASAEGLTLTEIATRQGLAPSSAHRLLTTLAEHGFAEADPEDQTWSIGVEAFRVGQAFQRRNKAFQAARPVMRRLMETTGETANLGIFAGDEVVFVAQVESNDPIRAFFRAGERRAAHASGVGKALLAELPEAALDRLIRDKGLQRFTDKTITDSACLRVELAATRLRGYALDDEERSRGMRCIAAAIFDENGEAVAGISISGPSGRLDQERIAALGPEVAAAATRITRAIGGLAPRQGAKGEDCSNA